MSKKEIQQKITFSTNPLNIYALLLDSNSHEEISGYEANISNEVGGKLTMYDGYIEGENLELIPGKKIVQKWKAVDWPENEYSTITYEFNEVKGQTEMKFTQTNIPAEFADELADSWMYFYWAPIQERFEE